eukprot:gnl/Hemi2/20234_TR6706_c1_g1_i1.p1 gnl/Hemi2/20234_TR6706_c1_g1~~gnl/Hemi2/20234_TR6706_c1_g1_i1.p1  ORF type:complete len:404 (-),score=142.26 gnl/Hemi2/20234_TR6706_c1_g1_i1:1000-2211(-)
MKIFIGLLAIAFVCVLGTGLAADTGCVGPDGSARDWWFVYKMPNGASYAYADANTALSQAGSLDDGSNPLAETMKQVYPTAKSHLSFLMFNDEPPNQAARGSDGHTKGVIGWDNESGFWLIQSIPKYPNVGASYDYPGSSSLQYGQSLLCITFNTRDSLNEIAQSLAYHTPQVYASHLATGVANANGVIAQIIAGHPATSSSSGTTKITSQGGVVFTSFSKDSAYGKDLYQFLVQPALNVDLYVETWIRSPPLPSFCKGGQYKYNTWNVRSLNVDGTEFDETNDHSKWAVSATSSKPWVCIGGINRMSSQYKRAGGTICFEEASLWKSLHDSIVSYDDCSGGAVSMASGVALNANFDLMVAGILIVACVALVGAALYQKRHLEHQAAEQAAGSYRECPGVLVV